jgi:serpin B
MTKKLCIAILLLAALLLFSACQSAQQSKSTVGNSDNIQEAKSSAVRISAPSYNASELKQLVGDNNEFALDLYKQVKDDSTNVVFSPYSISMALGMTYAGARNQTETQMAAALHFNCPQDKLHLLFNALDSDIASRQQYDSTSGSKYLKLVHVNSLWAQNDYSFLNKFLDVLMMNYGSGMRLVNFKSNPEQARHDINQWVADNTANKIPELLPSGDVDSYTRLVLTNAMYFNAAWNDPFNPSNSTSGYFNLENGNTVRVLMMTQQEVSFSCVFGSGYQAVELPYYGNEFSMLVIVPDKGAFSAFEQSLNYPLIEGIVGNLVKQQIKLTMPRFSYKSNVPLKDKLSAMGMTDAINPNLADLSGMDGTRNLYISNVYHQANIIVNEAGTEASAATAVKIGYTSLPKQITIDRPFLYMIRDIKTGVFLFVGKVKNPTL